MIGTSKNGALVVVFVSMRPTANSKSCISDYSCVIHRYYKRDCQAQFAVAVAVKVVELVNAVYAKVQKFQRDSVELGTSTTQYCRVGIIGYCAGICSMLIVQSWKFHQCLKGAEL